jgi:hypothetical protein
MDDYQRAIEIATRFEAMPCFSKAEVLYFEETGYIEMRVYNLDGSIAIQAGRLVDDAQAA